MNALQCWCKPATCCPLAEPLLLLGNDETHQMRRSCYRFSEGITRAGRIFDTFMAVLIMLNVVAVIAESEPSLGSSAGPSGMGVQRFFDGFEVRDLEKPAKRGRIWVDLAGECFRPSLGIRSFVFAAMRTRVFAA